MSKSVWRIGTVTKTYSADDKTGEGAYLTGGRWNDKGVRMLYTSESRALACLETLVHLDISPLPLNRFLVEYLIPEDVWARRYVMTQKDAPIGWDAQPAGIVSIHWGSQWAKALSEAILVVPSAIVPEETNILINPNHDDCTRIEARMVRKWTYDHRLD